MASSELPSLTDKVCIVTGASRGIGKGIALMLAKAGATVYITGRTLDASPEKPGSLRQTAEEIGQEGAGQCIPVQCDHGNDEQVKQLFDKVSEEQNGRLDVLVNNAASTGVEAIFGSDGKPFYEQPINLWDDMIDVGVRSNYVAAWYAAKMMVPANKGLIVNMSGAVMTYTFSVALGVGKAAIDRMVADMAVELRQQNVACVSLWPGSVKTEAVTEMLRHANLDEEKASKAALIFKDTEDATFTGKAVAWLAADPNIMKKSGRVQIVAEVAREYGFKDVGGVQPLSIRQVKKILQFSHPSMAWLMPEFVYIPFWLLAAMTHKF